jgi:hypothetical protein
MIATDRADVLAPVRFLAFVELDTAVEEFLASHSCSLSLPRHQLAAPLSRT